MRLLDIPYISQVDEGRLAINDCGPASALMVARAYGFALGTSIDDLYRAHGYPDTGLYVSTIMALLASLGVPNVYVQGDLTKLRGWLDQRRPPILLVDYDPIERAGLHQFYASGHFVVATGHDANGFYVHDPYMTGDRGAYIYWPASVLDEAWRPHGQYNYTAILPAEPLNEEGDDMADLNAVKTALRAAQTRIAEALAELGDGSPAPAPAPTPVILEVFGVGTATLRVRSGPGTNYSIIGALRAGQRVTQLEERSGWVRHQYGWSSRTYLRPI